MGQNYVKQIYQLQVGTWTPIIAPIDCNVFWVQDQGGQQIRECTDPAPNSDSPYDLIKPGVLQFLPQYVPNATMQYQASTKGGTRFQSGQVITNLAADTEASTCTVTFIL